MLQITWTTSTILAEIFYCIIGGIFALAGFDALKNQMVRIRARGYEAIVLQHEMDHFKGTLFYDHINKSDPFKEIENAIVIE